MTKSKFNPKNFLAATELSPLENQNVRGGKKKNKKKKKWIKKGRPNFGDY